MSTFTKLNLTYYASIFLAVVAAAIGFWGAKNGLWYVDPQSKEGIVISYVVILYTLLSVPGGLGLHNRMVKTLAAQPEHQKEKKYCTYSLLRLIFIGIGLIVSIFAFYLLQQKSLVFCAGISAVGVYFCKPTRARIEYEMSWTEKTDKQEK